MLFTSYYLWIAPHVLLAIFAVCLFRRGLQRQLPLFSAYVVFECIQFAVLFVISLHTPFSPNIYRKVLVIGEGISSILELGVIYELANQLLFSHSSLGSILRPAFRGTLAVLVLGSAIATGAFTNISFERVTNLFQAVDFSSNLIEAGMVLALFAFARISQVSWRNWIAGIALGLGVSACVDLGAAALREAFGKSAFVAVDITQMASFHLCVVIWLAALFLSHRAGPFPDADLKASDLELWNQELQRMVQR
jgi:hypothetical protein